MNRLQIIQSHISHQAQKFTKLSLSIQDSVGYITMNSPKDLNCLSLTMLKQISDAVLHMHKNQQVNVIVIRSSHQNVFCAGADIKEFIKHDYEFYIRNQIFNVIQNGFNNNKKTVIAAVNGKALGGGFQLALLCDIIIASQKAYFALPQINLGLMPGIGGTQRLTKIIGPNLASRYILTGDGFNGTDANRLNVCQLVKAQKFDENVKQFANKIASKSLSALMVAKRSIKFAVQSNLSQGLQFQKSTFYPMMSTKAAKQGITAFIQKRKPNFKGI